MWYDDAVAEHERELALNELLNDKLGVAVAHRKLGECYCKKGEFQRALRLHKTYLALARECSNALEEQRALATIGKTYLDQRDVGLPGSCRGNVSSAAERAFSQSLEVCEKLKPSISQTEYLDMKARLFLNLGLVYDGCEKAELSNSFLEKALTISKKEQFLDVLYLCQCCLGDLHQRHGRYNEAHQCMDGAAGTARRMKDKQLEGDALYSKALIAVQTDDFVTSQHILKKSHKLALPGSEQAQKVLKCYQTVKKIEQAMRDIKAADEGDWDTIIPLYDRLGDLTAEIGLYKQAVRHYQRMLSVSASAGRDKKDLAVIHVSIAETLKDDRQYDKAITHYRKEIECRSDKEQDQICSSLMSIGVLQEQAGHSYKEVQIAYVDAFNAAKRAKNLKLQVRCLNYLIELFKANKASKLLAKVEEQISKLRAKHQLTDTDLEEEESQEEGDAESEGQEEEAVMSDLTESEDETEKVDNTRMLRAVRQSRTITKKVKLNEFGETPLHKACIAGDLEKVKSLLDEGHPLSVQDNNGWTPLHEAANNGHYEVTQLLLEHGADIDHRGGRGCEGLTPLIDAASAGNFEIMMLLVDKGANVNAKDDKQMKALDHLLAFRDSCGELEREEEIKYRNLLQILRERDPGHRSKHGGASVVLSQRAISALVPEGSKRRSSAGSQRRSRNDIIMASDSDSEDGRDTRHKAVPSLPTDSLDDLPSLYSNPHLHEGLDPDRNARDTYRHAMVEVGRSGCHASQAKPSTAKSKEISALLQEDEMVDDWLIEDVQPVKRRKVDVNGYMSTLGIRAQRTSIDSPSHMTEPSPGGSASKKRPLSLDSNSPCHVTELSPRGSGRKKRPLSLDSDSDSNAGDAAIATVNNEVHAGLPSHMDTADFSANDFADEYDDDDNVRFLFEENDRESTVPSQNNAGYFREENIFLKTRLKKKPRQTKLTGFVQKTTVATDSDNISQNHGRSVVHIETNSVNHVQEKMTSCVLKVKVKIKEEVFFIPVVESTAPKTFAWLAEEASSRYYKKCGLKPHVTLGTTDGAHFSPDDVISLMVADGDKIEGFLESWDLPPIAERYTEACKLQKTVVYKNVQLLLQSSEATGKLELADLALRTTRFKPVTRAIQCQTCLRHLDIRGNRIGDLGVESLCGALGTLPNLTHLGLACNDITSEGLKHLCDLLASDTDKPLKNLSSLDLSHNPLYDTCLSQLAGLVGGLPGLTHLGMSSCNLTVKLFQNNRLQLTEALHKSSVQQIDISYNSLGCVGLELFLKCQNPTKVQTLDLSATLPGTGSSSQVYRHLYNYCTQDGCALQSLKLHSCNLGIEDIDFLSRLPSQAKCLQCLDVSGNPRLTNLVLQQLLHASVSDGSQLETLRIKDCKLTSPLGVDLLDSLAEKLGTGAPLRRLEFTCHKLDKVDSDSLRQIWTDRWEELADVTCHGQEVKLGVKDS